MLKFLDIARTPTGDLVLLIEVNYGRDAYVAYIEENPENRKVAWWKEKDLDIIGNVYSILAEGK